MKSSMLDSHGLHSAGPDGSTPGSGAGSTGETAADVISEEGGSTMTHGGRRATVTTTPVQKPAPFDGKLTWDAYHTQFEMLARINYWSDADKTAYLAISLRGLAATVLTNLPQISARTMPYFLLLSNLGLVRPTRQNYIE